MKEVNFYKGPSGRYNKKTHGDGIYFATDTLEILVDGLSYGSVEVDDTLTEIGVNPVEGRVVYKAIKDTVKDAIDNAQFGAKLKLLVSGNNVYTLLLLDKNNNVISSTEEFAGDQSGTYDPSGIKFSLLSGNQQVKEGQKVYIDLTFDVKDLSGNSMGRTGQLSLMRDSEENIVFTQEIQPGQGRIEITDYVQEGLTKFWVEVEAETLKGIEKTRGYFTILIVNISIDTNYDISKTIISGLTLTIPVLVQGVYGSKYIRAYLNGVEVNPEDPVTYIAASGTTTVEIPTKDLAHGTHNILLRADYEADGSVIYSNIIYLDLIIREEGAVRPLFACRFDYENGDYLISGTPIVKVSQYDPFLFQYYVWSKESNREVLFYSEGVNISNENISETTAVVNYRYTKSGVKKCFLEYQGYNYNFSIDVKKSNYQIVEPTTGMLLYLDAFGKSNNSDFRNVWQYEDVTSTFENFNWSGDGWTGNSLKLFNGSKVTINHKPFEYSTGTIGAMSFIIKFKVSRAVDPNEVVISCIDEYGFGLKITSQEATLITKSGTISTKFSEDLVYTLGIVSFPEAQPTSIDNLKNNSNMCYLYIDGIISKGISKKSADLIYQGNPQVITLQANSCELEVYSIRSYNSELGDDEMFDCYLIDLADSEKLAQEYEQNDILSGLGIDINKIAGKIPYFIITGVSEKEAYTLLDYISMIKDKDTKYPVSSILYVDDKDPNKNFIALPKAEEGEKLTKSNSPIIRCQGTSSMGYPRKNYRIYTDKSKLYLGCDNNGKGGVLQEDSLYSINSNSIPVDCWCLKADYAESSSSHNTGTAALVEEVFNNAELLTPAQKKKKSDYPYLIRTTVEGKPCLVFHRKYETDTPIFAGKYNFNNDKSTESVFGFCDIPGYHDDQAPFAEERISQCLESLKFPEGFTAVYYKEVDDEIVLTDSSDKDAEVATKEDLLKIYENNPTECWEFLNNTSEMGNFLKSDFTEADPTDPRKLYWVTTWESRFPGEDALTAAYLAGVQPHYLKTVSEWVTSTNVNLATNKSFTSPVIIDGITFTKDDINYRRTKFRSELSNYFDVDYLCAYYMITECLAAADQRVKNMMWGFWYNPDADNHDLMHKMRCYPIFYDNDTILGLDNSGVLRINWDADENTLNETGGYAFAGHDSTIWNNLRSEFEDRLETVYKRIRNKNMTNTLMFKHYNVNLSDKYCEKVYNKDAFYKYIIPENIGIPYTTTGLNTKFEGVIAKMDGSRKAHRNWFIENRMSKYDAKYNSGDYASSYIKLKSETPIADDENASILIITDRDWYYQLYDDSAKTIIGHKKATVGTPLELALNDGRDLVLGDIIYLYGIKWAKELDLSNWGGYLELSFTGQMPVLEKLILGGERPSAYGVPIPINNTAPALKYLDVRNIKATSLDLRGCSKLETLLATGSELLSVNFAENSNVNYLELPDTLVTLSLVGLPKLKNSGIKASYENLLEVRLENTDQLDRMALLNDILDKGKTELCVRITDLKLSGNGDDLKFYKSKNLKGLSANGLSTEECTLIGEYKLTTMLSESEYNELVAYFPYLDIQLPKYTHVSFETLDSTPYRLTNHDNNTGYGCLDTYSPSGHITRILDKRYSCLVKMIDTEYGEVNVQRLTDEDLLSMDPNVMLSGDKGDYCMYEPNYWYKGVNDHMNNKIHLFISCDTNDAPTINKHTVLTESDCVKVIQNKAVSTIKNLLTLVEDTARNVYHFDLTKYRNFKQIRITSTNAANKGSIIITESGNNKRIYAGLAQGMNDQSYLFTLLPNDATDIYITQDKNKIVELRLIESENTEAVEEGWVKHNECFIGKLLSVVEAGDSVNSIYKPAAYNNCTNVYTKTDNISAITACDYLIGNSNGFHFPMGYEQYKDILLLAYLKYGTTALHLDKVGVGLSNSTNINNTTGFPSYWEPRYISNPDYLKYGNTDTKINPELTNIPYNSCIEQGKSILYPEVSVLMGYYQFIGYSSTISTNDYIDSNGYYIQSLNDKEVRRIKIYNGDLKGHFVGHIIGGKYFDIFGVPNSTTNNITASECFCGYESLGSSGSSGYLSTGYVVKTMSSVITSSYLAIAGLSPVMNVLVYDGERRNMIRVVIAPNKINII